MYALYEKIKLIKIIEPDAAKGTFLFQDRFHFAVQYNIIRIRSSFVLHDSKAHADVWPPIAAVYREHYTQIIYFLYYINYNIFKTYDVQQFEHHQSSELAVCCGSSYIPAVFAVRGEVMCSYNNQDSYFTSRFLLHLRLFFEHVLTWQVRGNSDS